MNTAFLLRTLDVAGRRLAGWIVIRGLVLGAAGLVIPLQVAAQDEHPVSPAQGHVHTGPPASSASTREASGTAWVPELTPMYGFHTRAAGWDLMLHGAVFAQYLHESGEEHRRSRQTGSINWLMGTGSRPVGAARVSARAMVSLEPWTIRDCGYPNLTATGEMCRGDSIHDRQHPHDLFMELAVLYERPLTPAVTWHVYGGPVGEPALGPAAFPHRPSAFPNPIAPTTHHWLDATHITFGVVTAGLSGTRWRIEGSAFNGREPDPVRTDVDLAPFDSFSGRVSLAPTAGLSFQVSAGHLHESEPGVGEQPSTDVNRATASAIYVRRFGMRGIWAMTAAYGANSKQSVVPGAVLDQMTHGGLLEGSALFNDRHTVFGRLEVVGKPAHDLHVHDHVTSVFTLGKVQGGYIRHLRPWRGLLPGIGGSASAALLPPLIAPRYGGRVAPGFGVLVSLRPAGQRSEGR